MKKLDWAQLLGFNQVVSDRDRRMLNTPRIGGKVGVKSCEVIRNEDEARGAPSANQAIGE
jgi:hypothetical protein